MQDCPLHPGLVLFLVIAFLLAAGCSSTGAGTPPVSPVPAPAQEQAAPAPAVTTGGSAAGLPSQILVKNTGTSEVHVWISRDTAAWGGNHGNVDSVGGTITLSVPADTTTGTSPQQVCIGKLEKVLACREIAPGTIPASGTLVWDGTALAPAP